MSRIRFIRLMFISTPSESGSAPPDRPVPAPLATIEAAVRERCVLGLEHERQHQELMSALVKADKTNLIGETAVQRMGQNVQQAWDGLIGTRD